MQHGFLLVVGVVIVISSVPSSSTPIVDRSERNGLSDYEWVTLWSRDVDSDRGTPVSSGGGDLQTIADRTDFTFYEPPSTAGRWSERDFHDYEPGAGGESIAPSSAELSNSVAIKDAFVSVFALHPSTVLHVDRETSKTYIAETGTVTAAIDYRVEAPPNVSTPTRTENWTVVDHEIEEIRLLANQTLLADASGTHSPELQYELPSPSIDSLSMMAEITATLERTVVTYTEVSVNQTGNDSTPHRKVESRTVTRVADTVTVHEGTPVSVYSPTVTERTAIYPGGSQSVVYTVDAPFAGIATSTGSPQVLTNLRFFTAQDPRWDGLIRRTANKQVRVQSPAQPIRVHAYPSKRGSRTVPFGAGFSVDHVGGEERHSPESTIDSRVHVDVVEERYTSTRRIVVGNSEALSPDPSVRGLLANEGPIPVVSKSTEEVRETELVGHVEARSPGNATVQIELRDLATGAPVQLVSETESGSTSVTKQTDTGYITAKGRRYRTNESGVVTVELRRPGVYPVRYHPGAWTERGPAFVGDSMTIRWHPITSVRGWTEFGLQLLLGLLPLVGLLFAGREVGRLFGWRTARRDRR